MTIYEEIDVECARQAVKYADTDAKNTESDWIALIAKHAGLAYTPRGQEPVAVSLDRFRKQIISVAALAVAAVEWTDRLLTTMVRDPVDARATDGGDE